MVQTLGVLAVKILEPDMWDFVLGDFGFSSYAAKVSSFFCPFIVDTSYLLFYFIVNLQLKAQNVLWMQHINGQFMYIYFN